MQSSVSTKCAENAGAMATLVVDRFRSIVTWCGVLLLIDGVGVSSVTKRCVHRGEAIKLFSDTGGNYEGVSMYTVNQLWIATWSFENDGIKIKYMDASYSKRIYMDGNRNVWFLDVQRKDAGKYVFKCGIQCEQLDLELTVLEKLTEEQLQECPNKCPSVSKMDFETMTTVQFWKRYTKGVRHYTSTTVNNGDDEEGVRHYTSTTVNNGDDNEGVRHYTSKTLNNGDDKEGVSDDTSLDVGKEDDKEGVRHYTSKTLNNGDDKEEPLTEDQVKKWLHNHPDFMEKNLGGSHSETDHRITAILVIMIIMGIVLLVFIIMVIWFAYKWNKTRKLTEDKILEQIQKWLEVYPGLFMKKYLEILKEDQVHKWLNDDPDFMDKYRDEHKNDHQAAIPSLQELSVRLTQSETGIIEGRQTQFLSTQTSNASQSTDEHENDHQTITPTLVEPSATLTESGNETGGNQMQMSTRKKFIASQNSDEYENDHQAVEPAFDEPSVILTESRNEIEGNQMQMISTQKKLIASQSSDKKYNPVDEPTLSELAVTLVELGSGTEDKQRQFESSQEVITSSTCSNPSSDTFSVPGHSGIQPFIMDERDSNPEWVISQAERQEFFEVSIKEDSNSEDECKEPLLEVYDDQKPKAKMF